MHVMLHLKYTFSISRTRCPLGTKLDEPQSQKTDMFVKVCFMLLSGIEQLNLLLKKYYYHFLVTYNNIE